MAITLNGSTGITMPAGGTANTAGAAVGTTDTQTLSNKALVGVTDGSSASAGQVGEYISSDVPSGSAVSLTSTVAANVTSITLSAGDWDVSAAVLFNPGGTTSVTVARGSVSLTSATIDTTLGRLFGHASAAQVPAGSGSGYASKVLRFSVTSPTVVYLVATSTFTVSTQSVYGNISARRVR